jgi:hypothetical protein
MAVLGEGAATLLWLRLRRLLLLLLLLLQYKSINEQRSPAVMRIISVPEIPNPLTARNGPPPPPPPPPPQHGDK